MRPLDIAFMKAVHHKVNIVPVIAKADTLTKKEVLNLKRKVGVVVTSRNNFCLFSTRVFQCHSSR